MLLGTCLKIWGIGMSDYLNKEPMHYINLPIASNILGRPFEYHNSSFDQTARLITNLHNDCVIEIIEHLNRQLTFIYHRRVGHE
jgi:hypothetical protein